MRMRNCRQFNNIIWRHMQISDPAFYAFNNSSLFCSPFGSKYDVKLMFENIPFVIDDDVAVH